MLKSSAIHRTVESLIPHFVFLYMKDDHHCSQKVSRFVSNIMSGEIN